MLALGRAMLHKVVDLDPFALPLGFLLPASDLEEIRHEETLLAPHHMDFPNGNILLGIHGFLLRAGGLNILIDSCVGEHKHRPRRPDWHARRDTGFLARLAAAGASPDEIDVVLCTHLHADHVGWNTRLEDGRWTPTFPKARYVMGRTELAHWEEEERRNPGAHNHGAYRDSVLPVVEAGLCEPVDDGFELGKGMTIVPLAGHSPVQVRKPHWSSVFCSDGDMAARLRLALCERSADGGTLLLPAHIRHTHGMRARRDGAGFRPHLV